MKNTMQIFGMAKSSLNLNGAKRQKLELDYLRLVYARQIYPFSKAYLVVASRGMEKTVLDWAKKYKAENEVVVSVLPVEELTDELRMERARNVRGMIESMLGSGKKSDAVAALGERICEEYLLKLIRHEYPGVKDYHHCQKKVNHRTLPLCINWDFYAEY